MPLLRWHGSAFGSSPRARGTLVRHEVFAAHARFIPASAGNTRPTSSSSRPSSVHPRERGEHARLPWSAWNSAGSSPRARGTRVELAAVLAGGRFIPASAGNTTRSSRPRRRMPVHPRERGEHVNSCSTAKHGYGSSPRARGTPGADRHGGAGLRFIPASAGNTIRASTSTPSRPVHPRERGEHFPSVDPVVVADGSSPRARGTQDVSRDALVHHRFIPASAGNTPGPRAP